MAKLTDEFKMTLLKKTKEALKLSIQSSIRHSRNVATGQNHTSEFLKIIKEDKATIQRLNNVIDMKQREVDSLNKEHVDLLWRMAGLEKKVTECEAYKKEAAEVAEWEKKLTEFTDSKKVDN
jgi:uncharacterized protein YcbK (DUF882 family)